MVIMKTKTKAQLNSELEELTKKYSTLETEYNKLNSRELSTYRKQVIEVTEKAARQVRAAENRMRCLYALLAVFGAIIVGLLFGLSLLW